MRVTSIHNESNNLDSDGEVILLKYGERRVIVELPNRYEDLLKVAREVFSIRAGPILFSTKDLDICEGVPAEIHSSSWRAMYKVVSSVTVSVSPGPRASMAGPSESKVLGDVTNAQTRIKAAALFKEEDSDHALKTSAVGYATLRDNEPHEDEHTAEDEENIPLFDEQEQDELDENDDDEQLVSPTKGKGKGRARRVINSDDEMDQVEEQVLPSASKDDASRILAARLMGSVKKPLASPRSSLDRNVKAFMSPKPKVMPRDVEDMFSPKVNKIAGKAPSTPHENADNQDEQHNDEGAVSDDARSSHGSDRPSKKGRPSFTDLLRASPAVTSTQKVSQISYPDSSKQTSAPPASSKFKPASNSTARGSERAPSTRGSEAPPQEKPQADEKIFVTISHAPSGNESKFKFKGKHAVGRVLMSACQAFGLDYDGARLMLVDEDYAEEGIEMSYELSNDDTMLQAGVVSGNHLVIAMEGESA